MKLDTVAARSKLPARNGPYWHRVAQGQHLGFRVGVEGGTWFAKYRDADTGKRHQTGLGEFANLPPSDRFDAAMQAARDWFAHLGKGGAVQTYTVKDACDRYVAALKRTKGDTAALDAEQRFARHVESEPLARVMLDKLRPIDVKKWREQLQDKLTPQGEKRSDSALNRDMSALRAALNLAHRDQLVVSDTAWAAALLPISNADRSRDVYLDRQQRQALIDAAGTDLGMFMRVLCALPLRPGAMASLTVGDYDRRLKTLKIDSDKAGAGRRIQLPDTTAALFDQASKDKLPAALLFTRADGAKWIKDKWSCPFKAAAAAAGVNATLYALRHSTITDLVHAGVDLLTVAQISGTSLAMIERHYGHLTGATAAAALAKVAP